MLKVLGAACAALLISLASCMPALAADKGGPVYMEPGPAPSMPNYNRTGFYVGLLGGYDVQRLKADDFKFGEGSLSGGAMAGFNYNTGMGLVLGLEADYMLNSIKSSSSAGGVTVTASNHFLASVRARAGLPVGHALVYVTAGPAFTERKGSLQTGPFVSDFKDMQVGAVFGGGIETELTRTLFVRLEALHYVFPDKDVTGMAGAFTSAEQQSTARIAIGFKLN